MELDCTTLISLHVKGWLCWLSYEMFVVISCCCYCCYLLLTIKNQRLLALKYKLLDFYNHHSNIS